MLGSSPSGAAEVLSPSVSCGFSYSICSYYVYRIVLQIIVCYITVFLDRSCRPPSPVIMYVYYQLQLLLMLFIYGMYYLCYIFVYIIIVSSCYHSCLLLSVYVQTYVFVIILSHRYIHTYIYVCIYTCIYIYIYICMYMYNAYKYMHIQRRVPRLIRILKYHAQLSGGRKARRPPSPAGAAQGWPLYICIYVYIYIYIHISYIYIYI